MAATNSCSLVYQLERDNVVGIEFSDFHLIIRSLHSYMVESIVPDETTYTVTVKLNYNANIKNVRTKLGGAAAAISVSKVNPNLELSELSRLNQLRATFNFGESAKDDEDETPQPPKKRKYKSSGKPNI